MSLSATAIKNSKPKDKNYKLFDGRGLYLLVTPKGKKWLRFDYRFQKKRKTLSMGVTQHPIFSSFSVGLISQ